MAYLDQTNSSFRAMNCILLMAVLSPFNVMYILDFVPLLLCNSMFQLPIQGTYYIHTMRSDINLIKMIPNYRKSSGVFERNIRC